MTADNASLFYFCCHMMIVFAMLMDNQKETYVLRSTPACSFCSGILIKAKKYNCQLYIISQNLGRMNRTLFDVLFWFK